MKPLAIIAAMALSACSGHIATDAMVEKNGESLKLERIFHNNGGTARGTYQAFVARQKAHGYRGYMIDGPCVSACVYWALYSPHSCYTRSATLGLHLATQFGLYRTPEIDAFNAKVLAYLPAPIATKLRQIDNHTALEGEDVGFDWLIQNWPEGYCGNKYGEN